MISDSSPPSLPSVSRGLTPPASGTERKQHIGQINKIIIKKKNPEAIMASPKSPNRLDRSSMKGARHGFLGGPFETD